MRHVRSMGLAPLILLIGCSHTYQINRPVMAAPTEKLERSASAYVALPQDGVFEGRIVYEQSGQYTADVIQKSFQQYLHSVQRATVYEPYETALQSAKNSGARYLVYTEILHWEDRQTAWSGMPDRILLRLSVIDTRGGVAVDSAELKGTSRWFTFGGDDPKDLVAVPANQYVASLF